MKCLQSAVVVAAVFAGGLGDVADGAVILDFTGGGTVIAGAPPPGTSTVAGWEFKVTSAITVDGIGIFDVGNDGLTASHDVGLWNGDGSVLFLSTIVTNAATVEASTSAAGRWLFVGISPLILLPGNYVLGARYGEDPPDFLRGLIPGIPGDSATTVPGVTFVQGRADDSATLAFPDFVLSAPLVGVFGPNLRLAPTAVAVPEPSMFLLFGGGLVAVTGFGRRRNTRQGT